MLYQPQHQHLSQYPNLHHYHHSHQIYLLHIHFTINKYKSSSTKISFNPLTYNVINSHINSNFDIFTNTYVILVTNFVLTFLYNLSIIVTFNFTTNINFYLATKCYKNFLNSQYSGLCQYHKKQLKLHRFIVLINKAIKSQVFPPFAPQKDP